MLQWAWYDSAEDYVVQPKSLVNLYSGSASTDYCTIFGGWDEATKAAISGLGDCEYSFCDGPGGYLKEASPDHAADFKTGAVPMIWMSKRKIKIANMAGHGIHGMVERGPTAVQEALLWVRF